MPSWLSSEDYVARVVMTRIYESPIMQEVKEQVFDEIPTDVPFDTYIVLGESNITEREYSQALYETVSLVLHVYHKDDEKPENAATYTRGLVRRLKFILLQPFQNELYICASPRLELSQVITDIDSRTKHGVIRLKYEVRHKIR